MNMEFNKQISFSKDDVPVIHFIYRVCDGVNVCSARERCFNVSKAHLISRCLDSLKINFDSSRDKIRLDIDIVEDLCSDATIERIKDTFSGFGARLHHLGRGSNAHSFCGCVEIATTFPDDDIVFLCEDDYLFLVDDVFYKMAFSMKSLMEKNNGEYVGMMPDDYPDRYHNGVAKNRSVVSLETGHFMSIDKTTCTFSTFAGALKNHRNEVMNFINWPFVGEDQSVNLMWRRVPLFCPLPAWTLHSQLKAIIPPYLDFGKIDDYFRRKNNDR